MNVINPTKADSFEEIVSNAVIDKKGKEKLQICEKCEKNDNGKTTAECFICKRVICRVCAGNDNTAKKKEYSNFICTGCLDNPSTKKR